MHQLLQLAQREKEITVNICYIQIVVKDMTFNWRRYMQFKMFLVSRGEGRPDIKQAIKKDNSGWLLTLT